MAEGKRGSGEKIRQARLRAGLTQEQLARRVNVTSRNVVRWETGRTTPRLEHLIRLAAELGVTIADIIDEDDADAGVSREQKLLNVGLAVEALLNGSRA